jgi:aryl-alcohol dehydrogenase-like predicted oxidoreductase
MTFGSEVLGTDEGTSRELIARYTAAGGNFIDTANGYSQGRSEEVIGAYLAGHKDLRDRLVIATKFAANLFPGDPNGGGAGRKAILHQVEYSLLERTVEGELFGAARAFGLGVTPWSPPAR